MRTFVILSLASIAFIHSASAWVGGPWSGNVADNSAGEGTYQGTIRGDDLIGVFFFKYGADFAWNPNDQNIAFAQSTFFYVFHKGNGSSGETTGVVDTEGRTVSGNFEGSGEIREVTNVILDPITGVFGTQTTFVELPGEVSGGFVAKMTTTSPQIRFEGDGQMTTTSVPTTTTPESIDDTTGNLTGSVTRGGTVDIKVTGVRTSISQGN